MTAVINSSDMELLDRDRDLVKLHQSGNAAAFSALYALHYGRLVRFCTRLTRDPHAAEEVAQEAFARAFASLDQLNGERRFYPWLTVVARRLVIDRARERARYESRAEMDSGYARAAEDIAVQRMDRDHIAVAFSRLSQRHQDVLRLRDWEGLSYDDIAERLGVPTTTVAPLLHRARSSLRREYLGFSRSRAAAWLHLAPLIAAARRLRDRMAIWMGHLPDPSIFAAPMAGAVLGASMLLAPQAMLLGGTASHLDTPAVGGLRIPHDSPDRIEAARPKSDTNAGQPPVDNSEDIFHPGYAVRDAGVRPQDYHALRSIHRGDPETWEERDRGMRRMPIYYRNEQTGIFIAADPSAVGPFVDHVLGR